MVGNLLISLIAGATAFVCLLVLGVPSPFVLAVWVAFADLIPLVGAILGAIVVVGAAFLHGTTAGIVAIVFFVVYQQVENSVIYPAIMARRVKVNPLVVLLSFLLGVTIFGWLGAVLAVPISGAVQVAVKAIMQERRPRATAVGRRRHRRRRTSGELTGHRKDGRRQGSSALVRASRATGHTRRRERQRARRTGSAEGRPSRTERRGLAGAVVHRARPARRQADCQRADLLHEAHDDAPARRRGSGRAG